MHAKGFRPLFALVIIMVSAGCDNVEFAGFQFELRPPEPAAAPPPAPVAEEVSEEGPSLLPLDLGSIVYVAERGQGSAATLLPVAVRTASGYEPLPTPDDIPDLIERFPVNRLEPGTEFDLFAQGLRVGTFLADGGVVEDRSTCRLRPRGTGRMEVRPDLASVGHFLAIPRSEGTDPGVSERAALAAATLPAAGPLGAGSVTAAQVVLQAMNIPWPPSVPEARRDLQPLAVDSLGTSGFAATFLYGGALDVRPTPSVAYALFLVAEPGPDRPEPVVAWYQRSGADGKAFPRLLAAHDLGDGGRPDLVLEVFGAEARWLAILGPEEDGDWAMLYQDPCGVSAARGGIRSFR